MSKLLRYEKFLETNLTLPELNKVRGGQLRGQVLVNKLKNEQPLTTTDDKDVHIQHLKVDGEWDDVQDGIGEFTTNGQYDPAKAEKYFKNRTYTRVLQDDDGEEFALNQLKKTKDFGSSGSGVRVREFESIQAIFLAIKQAHPEVELEPGNAVEFFKSYVKNILRGGKDLLFIPENIKITEDLIEGFVEESDWIETFCRIPNEIWKQDYHIDKDKLYRIYQIGYSGNCAVSVLKSLFREFSINEKFKDINFAKWCPADVYMVDSLSEDEIMDRLSQSTNINELTRISDDLFDEGKLIPLSLKKIKKEKLIHIITNKEKEKNLPVFKITGFTIGSDMKGIGSKISTKSYWTFRDDKFRGEMAERDVSLDSSDSSRKQNIDGEVEGSASRHGKISWVALKRLIDARRVDYPNITPLLDVSELKKLNVDELEVMCKDLISEIRKQNTKKKVVVREMTRGRDISGNEGKLMSRIQSLQIIQALNEIFRNSRRDANEVMTKIMRYALSIQTDKFDTPRYLRVI